MIESQTALRVQTFVGPDCKGNDHYVIESESVKHDDFISESLRIQPSILVVLNPSQISLLVSGHDSLALEPLFFHKGHQVQVCGSGLLAIPHYFRARYEFAFDRMVNVNLSGQCFQIGPSTDGNRFALELGLDMRLREVEQGNWPMLLGAPLNTVIELNDSYVIAELSCASDLAELSPDLEQLCRVSSRALIVTAKANISDSNDYLMRYFAPQYGNPEDAATGSANLYLMKYWQSKLNKQQLKGRQLSLEGGLFYGQVNDDSVTLSGDARVDKSSDSVAI